MNKVALFAIIGTAMFLLSGATAFAATPSSAPVHIQPNPTMNTNVTWSTFYHGWSALEYSNGTGNKTLNTGLSGIYANPITIDPAKIAGISGKYKPSLNESEWNKANGFTAAAGTVYSVNNNSGKTTLTTNGSNSGASLIAYHVSIPATDLPSNNPQYDWFSIIINASGPSVTGENEYAYLTNGTNHATYGQPAYTTPDLYGSGEYFASISLATLEANQSKYGNMNITSSRVYNFGLDITTPSGTGADTWSTTLQAFMMTENQLYLGSNSTSPQVSQGTGSIELTSFNPDFSWSKIINSGYSVAVSQPLQNLTTQQNAISSGNYIEQVEYQGQFVLPTAPDLSYGATNLSEQFNVSTAQTQVLDINGVSYLSTISGKNGTVQLLSSVNPNSQTQFLQIVDYTQSQWNSISVSPGIFTIAGIEYYWWIAVGGLATLIGLAAAAKHAGTKADQERMRRGR